MNVNCASCTVFSTCFRFFFYIYISNSHNGQRAMIHIVWLKRDKSWILLSLHHENSNAKNKLFGKLRFRLGVYIYIYIYIITDFIFVEGSMYRNVTYIIWWKGKRGASFIYRIFFYTKKLKKFIRINPNRILKSQLYGSGFAGLMINLI